MIASSTMKAAAQVIARARDVVREAGRDHRHNDAVVPDAEFQALAEALDDWDGLNELQPATDDDWREWANEEDEDGPNRTQRITRLMHR